MSNAHALVAPSGLLVGVALCALASCRLVAQMPAPADTATAAVSSPRIIQAPAPLFALPTPFLRTQVADTLLPVFDDVGTLISEDAIAARMRRGRNRQVVAGVLGLVVGGLLMGGWGMDQCEIFEQCSDRDDFYSGSAIWFGAAIGLVLGAGVIEPGVDRWRAVELIRRERRPQPERR